MAEYGANAVQIVAPGESIVFNAVNPCERGLVRHRQGSENFLLSGWLPFRNGCCCNRRKSAQYLVEFGANISIPEDGTVEEISVAITIDGATIPSTAMRVTPAAVDEYWNVSRAVNVDVWRNCCQTVTVRNTSSQPIQVKGANIIFSRPDLVITY